MCVCVCVCVCMFVQQYLCSILSNAHTMLSCHLLTLHLLQRACLLHTFYCCLSHFFCCCSSHVFCCCLSRIFCCCGRTLRLLAYPAAVGTHAFLLTLLLLLHNAAVSSSRKAGNWFPAGGQRWKDGSWEIRVSSRVCEFVFVCVSVPVCSGGMAR